MKQEQSKYRIIYHKDADSTYASYYKVQERKFLFGIKFLSYWSDICYHKANTIKNWYGWTPAFCTYEEAKEALEKYKNKEDYYDNKVVYEE